MKQEIKKHEDEYIHIRERHISAATYFILGVISLAALIYCCLDFNRFNTFWGFFATLSGFFYIINLIVISKGIGEGD